MTPTLPRAVDAPIRRWPNFEPTLACYHEGAGPRVLLVHSINAAASSYEVKPLFDALVGRFEVWCLDLPGYGQSERPKRSYDVQLFTRSIQFALDRMGRPAHLIALSLSAEFAARAVVEGDAAVESLTLVTPTGFSQGADQLRMSGATREIPGFEAFFSFGLWNRPLFDLLTSKKSIRYFLRRTFGSQDVSEGLVEYCWLSARQPGAQHAPYAFLSGKLFSKDIRNVYERLSCPVFLAHGTRGDFKDFSEAGWAQDRDHWEVRAYESGALVHYEDPRFLTDLERFLSSGHEALRNAVSSG